MRVAGLASRFADVFDSGDWGYLAGLWHDLGKYRPAFQRRIRGSGEQVEHAGVGAAVADTKGGLGRSLAFAIAGHHAGLANHQVQAETEVRTLKERLASAHRDLAEIRQLIPSYLLDPILPGPPPALRIEPEARLTAPAEQDRLRRRVEWWTRLLFSALVDADFLATEGFYDPARRQVATSFSPVAELKQRLDCYLDRFQVDTEVNRCRAAVLTACRAAATGAPGVFSLTVPTGGGKTLASMAFALRHAECQGLRRVIVVIPYTSIIEQNAAVYRAVFGAQNVIEHHSAVDEIKNLETASEWEVRRRLAAENWDAPIIVTTNVQFFESLFANRPSRCRKLHNIARSVVVLDEAQHLPADYLTCLLEAIQELRTGYGCSLVLMTATQPALRRRVTLPAGLDGVQEIIADPDALARALDRVEVHWPTPDEPPTPYRRVAEHLQQHVQVLAIVHLRRDARELARMLPAEHRFHLSALQCAAHRSEILAQVKAVLDAGRPCRLVATQLVEAGVDIDFPVVYRALAGLDSVAQAAGRCNREGKLRDVQGQPVQGQMYVFRAETKPPRGILRLGLESSEALLARYGSALRLGDQMVMEEYFRTLYGKCELDRYGIQGERAQLNFATVAQRVRLIEDDYSCPVVVPWGDSVERVAAFRRSPTRATQRALQPYLVQLPRRDIAGLRECGALEMLSEEVDVLTLAYAHLYDEALGLVCEGDAQPDPEVLIVG